MFDTALPEPPHEDLFGNGVHRALQKKGNREKVLEAARGAVFQGQRGSLQEALTGRKGMRILNAASESLVRTAEAPPETAYSYSAWCLAGLPHRELPRDPESPDITPDWLIETGGARLLVRPGVRVLDDNSRVPLGVPFGSYARLLLIDWQTEALERGSREITIGTSASALAGRLGVKRGGPSNALIADQLERLSSCVIDFAFGTERKGRIESKRLVDNFDYVGATEIRNGQKLRLIERLVLSREFYEELRRHPVLIDKAALRTIMSSSMAIDIYLWLAFRLKGIEKETPVSWASLWKQFGPRVGALRNFRTQFVGPLHMALGAYEKAKVTVGDRGLLLEPSPPPAVR